jgi:hypothetical protein
MHIALRPYMTTGIAIVGAGIIAVAPVTVPPPNMPTVKVAAVNAARSITADVELTASWVDILAAVPEAAGLILQVALQPVPLPAELEALAIALVKAGGPAITETVKLFTETLPTEAQNLIATGQFAHLAVLAANTVYLGTLTPIAPFAVAVMEALPLPIGQKGGVIDELLVLGIQTPFLAGVTILSLAADVIDNGLSPVDALAGSIGAVYTAVTASVASVNKIVSTLTKTLPIADLAPPEVMEQARATVAELPAPNDTNVVASSLNSSPQQSVADTVTVTIESSDDDDDGDSSEAPATNDDSADEDVTANGATDLSDGNMAEPAAADAESGNQTNDDSSATTPDDQTATNDSDTGADEGSGAAADSAGE